MRKYVSVATAESQYPGCTEVIRTLYTDGRIDGERDQLELVFCVITEDDWTGLPVGTLLYQFPQYDGIAWWEDGRWLYSNFGDVCCRFHRPEGPDHGVYEYLAEGKIGKLVR